MAPRRRKLKDLLTPEPTPDKQLEHKSGWCMTGHHDGCKYQFDHGKCGCDCHKEPTPAPKKRGRPKKEVQPEASENADPRPWKR